MSLGTRVELAFFCHVSGSEPTPLPTLHYSLLFRRLLALFLFIAFGLFVGAAQEACRSDIAENRRLNYHLYEALRKSVYKPAAFYKGMLLPLASAGDCTLREAAIFASVLSRVSFAPPPLFFARLQKGTRYCFVYRVLVFLVSNVRAMSCIVRAFVLGRTSITSLLSAWRSVEPTGSRLYF